jgi:hypothetical protein
LNPNQITVDHGLDEEHIWAFGKSLYNQDVIKNDWVNPMTNAFKKSFAPFWGEKLQMPAWYKKEKMGKFYRHWSHRLGLEALKMEHATSYGANPSQEERASMKEEIANYIQKCYDYEEQEKLSDLYVTDHSSPEPKQATQNEEEDNEFYNYQ